MELKTFELEVEVRVRRTMRIKAPNPHIARELGFGWLRLAAEGKGELSSVLKWTDGRAAYRPMPVETLLLNESPPVLIGEPVEVE